MTGVGTARQLRVSVKEDRCCGSGNCVLIAPAVFDQDDEGVVLVLDAQPPVEQHAAVTEAESVCPVRAISITAQ